MLSYFLFSLNRPIYSKSLYFALGLSLWLKGT
nr:MAG TPA: hypothetical protein [Caudoviricetes sp.]